jgi:hypothetical protein
MASEKRKKVILSIEQNLRALKRLGRHDNEDNDAGSGLGLGKTERMSHSEGVEAQEVALAYVLQGEATATDTMSFKMLMQPCCKEEKQSWERNFNHSCF